MTDPAGERSRERQSTVSRGATRRQVLGLALGAAAAASAGAAAAGRLLPGRPTRSGPGAPGAGPQEAGLLAAPAVKALMTGLASRTGSVPRAQVTAGAITAIVVPLNWSDIETSKSVYTAKNLEAALNTALSTGLTASRLRISMGAGAPGDLLDAGIPSFYDPQGQTTAPMPLWWTKSYTGRATAMLTWLGQHYDQDPRIADVSFSAPCTFYSEWPIRQLVPENFPALRSANYTSAADKDAVQTMFSGYQAAFQATRISFADSKVWQDYSPPSTVTTQNAWFTAFLKSTRTAIGSQAIHGANNLDVNLWSTQDYEDITALGRPYSFQTQTMSRLTGSLSNVIEQAVAHGVSCVELPSGYQTQLTNAQMASYSQQLAANAPG
jgi:hypothetical protein